ncbi:MAG: hypothetical protein FWD41_01820 [Actinomycetia bacterium]|nr:hypothetical protein [Actinomycetes bacterium]
MISRFAELGIVETVILVGAALAFLVHPIVMLVASVWATVSNLATAPTTEIEKVSGRVSGLAGQH